MALERVTPPLVVLEITPRLPMLLAPKPLAVRLMPVTALAFSAFVQIWALAAWVIAPVEDSETVPAETVPSTDRSVVVLSVRAPLPMTDEISRRIRLAPSSVMELPARPRK